MHYILFLFGLCTAAVFALDNIVDFIVGFLAGWNEISAEQSHRLYDGISLVLGIIIIAAVGLVFYFGIAHKIGAPVKRLSEGMREVAKGNLSVRVEQKGSFEFSAMEKDFNHMAEQLERETESKRIREEKTRQLYADIAHDLKTPMTMVMGYAKLLESENELTAESRKRYLSTIIEQTEHTNELLDSLLMLTKLGSESYELKREQKDIAECLRICAANCYPSLEAADIPLEISVPDRTVMFNFDELAMRRVFTNLLSNAAKHNPEHTACHIKLEEDLSVIRIIIADNGPKIPDSLKGVLFDAFSVGDSSRNTKNGSGLGLSISKKIVERHAGKLFYLEEWGDGFKAFIIEFEKEGHEE